MVDRTIGPIRWIACLTLLVLISSLALAAELPTREELAALSQSHEDSLRAGRITYTSTETRSSIPQIPADILAESPGFDRLLESAAVVETLNRVDFDAALGLRKMDISDLRDIDAVIDAFSVPPLQQAGVSRTRVGLVDSQTDRILDYSPESQAFTMHTLPPGVSMDLSLRTGIIPSKTLSGKSTVTISPKQLDGRAMVEVTASGSAYTVTYLADAKLGYRFIRSTMSDLNGRRLRERIASDYRQVDGVWYPFRYEDRTFVKGTDQIAREEIITVDAACFEPPPAEVFALEIPAGTKVYNWIGPLRGTFTLRSDRRVDFDNADTLVPSAPREP